MKEHTILAKAMKGERLSDVFIVDCHGHIGYFKSADCRRVDPEHVVAMMDRFGIDLLCLNKISCPDTKSANDDVASAVAKYPDRIVGFAAVFPASGEGRVVDELRRCFDEKGFKGVKVHNGYENLQLRDHSGLPETQRALEAVWEFAAERRCPVLCHGFLTPDIARRYPEAVFVRAHACGNRAFAWEYRECRNVFFDSASSMMLRGNIEYMASIVGIERIVYGSDMPFANPAYRLGQVIGTDLDDGLIRQVLGRNMAGILGLNCPVC